MILQTGAWIENTCEEHFDKQLKCKRELKEEVSGMRMRRTNFVQWGRRWIRGVHGGEQGVGPGATRRENERKKKKERLRGEECKTGDNS